jgi:drug/metabolite transporter (DMT)-like permease
MKRKINHSYRALSLLVILGMIWGTGYSIARFAMTNGVPPLGYSFWQSIGPALIIGFLTACRRQTVKLSNIPYQFFFVCGLSGIVIPNSIMYFAAAHLPAGILALVVNTVPIVAYPMALSVGLEKFNWKRMIGIIFALFGIMTIIIPKSSLPDPNLAPWVLLTLITPLSFAFCSIYIARFRPAEIDTLTVTAGMLITSSIMLLPVVLLTGNFYWFHMPLLTPDWIILIEIALSSIGYVLFFQLIKIAGPVYYSLVDTIVVLTGLAWGYMIFNERLNEWTAIAVCLILLGLFVVTRQQNQVAHETSN